MAKKNQPAWRRFTFLALVVAGLALFSTILFLITKGLLNIGMFSGATSDTLNRGLYISGGITILALAIYVILEPEKTRRALTGRQARYGSNTVITSLAFLGILIVGNVLAYQYPLRKDLTEDKVNTLAPQTIQALESLPAPVEAVAFYSSSLSRESATKLLDNFKANSKGKFTYRFVNPDTDPIAAREAGITGDGKIMLVMGNRKEIASFASETELTKTLLRLINPEARVVYFLTGHGEGTFEPGDFSFSTAKQTLENKNYTVKNLNLLAENKIPEDALAIIIAGPQKPVSEREVELLKQYVDAGGSLVVMENPREFTEFGDSPDPLAEYLAKDWGIQLNDEVIIDLTGPQPLSAVSASYTAHPITQNLSEKYVIIMPQARPLSVQAGVEGVTLTELIFTSPNSWGETQFTTAEGSQISFDAEDRAGPLTMAVAGENTNTKGRVVVFGNSIFATDQGFDAYGNGNMFINSVDWAAEQEDLLNITPNTPISRTFILPSQIQWILILFGSVILLPGLVVLAGISTWIARRRQG